MDAAKAAAAVYYANHNTFPTTFDQLVSDGDFAPGTDMTVAGTTVTGDAWTLTMSGGGATAATFACQ